MKNALLLCCAANETHSQEPALFEYVPRRLYSTSVRNYISRISLDKIVLIATHVVSDVEYIAKNVVMFKKGVIVDNAAPHELLRKIDGKVWELYSTEEDLPALQNKYRVTNIAPNRCSFFYPPIMWIRAKRQPARFLSKKAERHIFRFKASQSAMHFWLCRKCFCVTLDKSNRTRLFKFAD